MGRCRWRAALWALAAAGALGGCAARADLQTLQNNQFTLRDMIAGDRQQTEKLEQQNRRLHDEIDRLKQGGPGSQATDQRLASLDDRLGKLEAAVSALQTATTAAPAPPAAGTTAGPSGAAAAAPLATPPWQADLDSAIEEAAKASGAAARLYRDGLAAMKEDKHTAAIAKFALLQKKYPKAQFSEPAEYFSANSFYESGKYDQAILQFNDLVMRFPHGRFASKALLREAQAFVLLNDKIDARLTLQKLQSDYRDTPEATAAANMLKELES